MRLRGPAALVALLGALVIAMPAYALASVPASGASSAPSMIRLAALTPHVPAGATRLGRLPSNQPMTISVVLQPQHADQLAATLHDLYDPSSPRYEHWLGTGEFDREFGPSAAQIGAVTSWLHSQGLTTTSVQGMAVRAAGNADAVAHALGVSFARYRLAAGATGYVASAAPTVPESVAGGIASIIGLSDTIRFDNSLDVTPRSRTGRTASAPTSAAPRAVAHALPLACAKARNFTGNNFWTADQVGATYHVNHLFDAGLTGRGTTIALLELGQSRASDTHNYLACFGLTNAVKVVHIDGGATPDVESTLEAEIDTQEAATQAPGATILSYEAPNDTLGEYDAYNAIVNDNRAQVVSTSWGKCEAALEAEANGTLFIDALHTLFQKAAAQGQSVFSATGDKGSEDCYDGTTTPPSETLQVDNPADDPFVTGVGGTSLEDDGTLPKHRRVEPVWNDCGGETGDACAAGGQNAGGGGESNHFKRPSWQVVAPNATCATCREVPDISANAGVGEVFYDSDFPPGGDPAPDNWTPVGGTSIAAPLLAGIAADVTQGCASQLGNFAARLSALAARHVNGAAFLDVTTGINWIGFHVQTPGNNDLTRTNTGKFKTESGYDIATGYGTPIATGLACPQINSMTPNHGNAGTHITLHGVGLEKAKIKFGTTPVKVLSAGTRSAVVIAPAGKGTLSVSGTDPMGQGRRSATFSYPGVDAGVYRTVAADGTVFNFGGARDYGHPAPSALRAPIVGMAVDHATGGYWLAGADGSVYSFNAPFLGSAGGAPLNQPIVGIAATKNGDGYWLVARDGGIFAYGKARYWGSTGGMHLNKPILGIALDPRTGGYWLVASDGGIFAFHAPFYGSTGAIHLNQPIVGIAADNATGGYWLVASDGGVFAFHAPFYGSTGAIRLNQPIVGISATDDARGYRFVASDGGVFNFGDAKFSGSTGGSATSSPVVAVAPAH